jgi:5-methylcytosine-specific restriction protein A
MSNSWTDEQLEAAIVAYLAMQYDYQAGKTPNKTEYYRNLVKEFGRTEGAWMQRMQNISHVFSLEGRSIVPGLKPLPNVGANVVEKIEQILAKLERRPQNQTVVFEAKVRTLLKKQNAIPPKGVQNPKGQEVIRKEIQRDPKVKAWVLLNAKGKCENCGHDAPFFTYDNIPFLEVHHVHRLADGGPDTINNAIALCPNCHREFHFGVQRDDLVQKIRTKIARLED